jgi:glycosyltransferase involved in cell wall biosynthesis
MRRKIIFCEALNFNISSLEKYHIIKQYGLPMVICLVTASYPYDVALEDTFLKEEVEIMSNMFTSVYILPRNNQGSISNLPPHISVNNELAVCLMSLNKLSIRNVWFFLSNVCFSYDIYREIITKGLFPRQIKNIKWLVKYQLKRKLVARYILDWININGLCKENIIFYTFWLDDATHGICDAIAPFHQNMKVISRAHGFDIYEERTTPPYWPLRPFWFDKIDAIYADSNLGRNYLTNKYPQNKGKFHVSLMGVSDSGFISSPSSDDVLRIVSCSMLRKLKRIDLIITSLKRLSIEHPEIPVEWTHFGNDTPELRVSDLMGLIDSLGFANNIKINFPGYDSQRQLYDFYRSSPIDCFITVSESEGTPVSILEAINCGIPIIATAVGGIVDLVSEENGVLLPQNPTEDQISESLNNLYLIRNSGLIDGMKRASKERWASQYNSSVNYIEFFSNIQNKMF